MITVNINRASGASIFTVLSTENYQRNAAIAADWVEYCNAPNNGSNPRGGTDWAAVRAQNGHPECYGVKYWELGNELWDMPLNWYTKAVQIFSKEMKSVDPTIEVGVVALPAYYQQEKYTQWFRGLLAEAGNSFDFWIHHMYTPAVSGKVNGFILTGQGASISTKVSFSRPGTCSLCFTAEPLRRPASVGLYLDGKPVDTFTILPRKEYCTKVEAMSGEHVLKLSVEKGYGAQIFHMMKKEDASGSAYIDLKNSPELYYLIVSGALSDEQGLWPTSLLGGKPVYITEYNSHYELEVRPPMLGQIYSLREALNVAQYLQYFARKGIPVATQWLLYDNMYGFGLIEGVGFDPNHGGVMGRTNPRPRPSYYVLKLYRDYLERKLLPVEVTCPRFHIGPPAPSVAMGFVGNKPMDVPFINAVASISEDGKRVALLVNNLHYDKEFSCKVVVKGFIPSPQAKQYVVSGATSWANNEPDMCPQGDCVSIVEKGLTMSGQDFSCTVPPHSASAIVLSR
jgi:alpha-L-arabinofuranosidase